MPSSNPSSHVWTYLESLNFNKRLAGNSAIECSAFWSQSLSFPGLSRPREQYKKWERLVQDLGIMTLPEYSRESWSQGIAAKSESHHLIRLRTDSHSSHKEKYSPTSTNVMIETELYIYMRQGE